MSVTFDAEELTREQQVILREIGQANDTPDDIIFDHFQETAFPGQPIGWPVLGRADIVAGLTRDHLFAHQARNYGAGGMVVAAAGKVEHGAFLARVREAFGGLASRPEPESQPGSYAGGEYRESRRLEQLHVVLGFDGVGYQDPDYYVAAVFSTLMGGGMSSRLFQEVREKRGLAYSIFTFNAAHSDGGLFGIYCGTSADQARALTPVLTDELVRVAGERLPEDELARARAQLKAGLLMGRERTTARVEQLANQLLIYGRPVESQEIVERIEAVDAHALEGFAHRLLRSQATLAALGPIRKLESLERVSNRLH